MTLPLNFSNTSSQEQLLLFSHSTPCSAQTNTIGIITPSYRHFLHLPQPSIALHTFQCSPCFIPFIHSGFHIHFISSIFCHLQPHILNTIYTSTNCLPCSLISFLPTLAYLEQIITSLFHTLT